MIRSGLGRSSIYRSAGYYGLAGGASPAPLPEGYNIIIAAGQSNMQGATALLVGVDDQTQTDFYAWGTGKGMGHFHTIYAGLDPLDTPATGGVNSGNTTFATQFARQYATLTGKKTLLVFVPVANTDLIGTVKQWQYTASPANPPVYVGNAIGLGASNLYSNMIYEANLAVAGAVAVDSASAIVGFLWAQGENDANQSINGPVYQAALSALVDGVRAQVTGASDAWFLINGMVPEAIYDEPLNHAGVYTNFRRITRAHKKITAAKAKMAYVRGAWGYTDRSVDVTGGQLGAIHYRDRGAWLDMAPLAITAMATAKAKTTGASVSAPSAPTIRTVTATSGQSLRLQLDRDFSQGNTDLVIQTSPAGANTWTDYYALSAGCYDYAEMVTIGGLTASTAYDVRVADVNSSGQSAWSATASGTTTASAAGYDFEADTVGAAPTGITCMSGPLQVIAGATSTQGTVYGKSIATTTYGGTTWDGWLDKVPVSADRTVTFRLVKDNASNSGQVLLVLRAQPDSPCGTAYSGEMRGYGFLIDYTATKLWIVKQDETSTTTRIDPATGAGAFFGQKIDQWYRCSCTGTTIKLEYSANGSSWTQAFSITDSTYTAGGVQINVRNSGLPAQLYIDSITWS